MKKEIRIFFTALLYFTRIPCPSWTDHSAEYLNRSSRYFPLIGILVGLLSAAGYILFHLAFSVVTAIVLSTALSALITGAFHEDGLADFFDGFGGGWTKEKILEIMKDSRVGTFGVLGLFFVLGSKICLLNEFNSINIPLLLVSGHSISRLTAVSFIYTHKYVREDSTSKSKPLANKMTGIELSIACFCGVIPLVFFCNPYLVLVILPLWITRLLLVKKFVRWIGGYTGDCLGATQQISEVVFYLSAYLVFRYIPWK